MGNNQHARAAMISIGRRQGKGTKREEINPSEKFKWEFFNFL